MINRLPDTRAIKKIYSDYQNRSGILLLFSRTGIGKTYLIDHIFNKDTEACYIRLRINQQEAEETKGLYISCLAKALNKYAHETGKFLTVEEFIETIYSIPNPREKVINDLLDIAADLIKIKIVKEKLEQNKTYKKDLVGKLLRNDTDVAVSFLLDYIIYISNDRKFVISIENIQQANQRLLSFLSELLRKTHNLFLIGEYTIGQSEEELTNFFREFPINNTEVYELKKLDKAELIGGIKHTKGEKMNEICEIIENSYDDSHGNLVKFELLIKKNSRHWNLAVNKGLNTIKYDDVVHSMYNSLTGNQRMALWYVGAHLGRVHIHVFRRFKTNPPMSNQVGL